MLDNFTTSFGVVKPIAGTIDHHIFVADIVDVASPTLDRASRDNYLLIWVQMLIVSWVPPISTRAIGQKIQFLC